MICEAIMAKASYLALKKLMWKMIAFTGSLDQSGLMVGLYSLSILNHIKCEARMWKASYTANVKGNSCNLDQSGLMVVNVLSQRSYA